MKYTVEIDQYNNIRWYKEGMFHCEHGHAVEYSTGSKFWYLNGWLHRLDGPAIEYYNGEKRWYFKGNRIDCNSQEEFEKYFKHTGCLPIDNAYLNYKDKIINIDGKNYNLVPLE